MTAPRLALTGALALSAGLAGLVGTAGPALAVCDAYSAVCPTPPPRDFRPPPPRLTDTGTELGLLTAIGAGTLAGGTALVVAARRKRPTTSS